MSEKMTCLSLPGHPGLGIMDWGEKSQTEMIAQIRARAKRLRQDADILDLFKDEDFRISVVLGPRRQKHLKTLQEGKMK